MNEKQQIQLPELMELVRFVRDNKYDKDPKINALLNCVIADNSDLESFNNLILLLQPLIVQQQLRANPFPLPEPEANGSIKFAVAEQAQFVGFLPDELHVLITGEPGTGKTSMTNFFIAPQAMARGIKCWFFVKARDTEKLIRFNKNIVTVDFDGQIKINPLQPPKNVSKHEWYASLWDMFIQAEAIYDGTKNFLIEHSYDLAGEYEKFGVEPSLFELYDFIKGKDIPRVSRDGKWIIIRVPGMEQAIIKPVAYFEKILERAKERTGSGFAASAEKIK